MNNHNHLSLIELSHEWRREFVSMAGEYRAEGDERYRDVLEDFDAYLQRVQMEARGVGLPTGRVASDTFCLVWSHRIIGRSRLRHRLTPDLEHEGGHIGYDIRPSERRKGYGTRLLALTLERASARGLRRVLLTCDADNIASARIIEKNGGTLDDQAISLRSGNLISRYWIELPGATTATTGHIVNDDAP